MIVNIAYPRTESDASHAALVTLEEFRCTLLLHFITQGSDVRNAARCPVSYIIVKQQTK